MQGTRQRILEILKEHGAATVDYLAAELGLTAVTVRHHLDVLRSEGLVTDPEVQRRNTRGRPHYLFGLTPQANAYFPKGYSDLAGKLIEVIKDTYSPRAVNVILEDVAVRFMAEAPRPTPGEGLEQRLERAARFLCEKGYVARWERTPEGYLFATTNCPYHGLASPHPELCNMDLSLVASLLGDAPERVCRVVEGAEACCYLIRASPAKPAPVNIVDADQTN